MSKKKFIRFDFLEKKPKTSIYTVSNIKYGNVLGIIKWHPHWRKYCFYSEGYAIYDVGCLNDIRDFIQDLMDKRLLEKKSDDNSLIDGTKIFKEE